MTDELTIDAKKLLEIFKNDYDLFLFYLSWIKNGLNATAAYKELHPDVKEHSASVLGSRLLGKVDKALIMEAYGLNLEDYFNQLKSGLKAMKVNEFSGELMEDHFARKPYHDKLGKLLGIERDRAMIEVQNNFMGIEEVVAEIEKRKAARNNEKTD